MASVNRKYLPIIFVGLGAWCLFIGYLAIRQWAPESDSSLRKRVERTVSLDRIQAWAIEVMDKCQTGEICEVPDDIRRVGATFVRLESETESTPRHVLFAFGGGFHHYGMCVGKPGFAPSYSGYSRHKWKDGIWGVHEQ